MTDALVTGATGLLGGALALELLRHTDGQVWCLVRAKDAAAAQERAVAELTRAAALYDCEELVPLIGRRVRGLRGDITVEGCGLDGGLPAGIGHVWHSAASLKYRNRDIDEIRLHNATGTANVLALARQLGAADFNYLSTAYVAGAAEGIIPESVVPADVEPNNAYETTKIEAERLVQAETSMRVRTLRPSIVIGHSVTYAAATWSGLYGGADQIRKFRDAVAEKLGNYLEHHSVSILGNSGVPANFIPVDTVAAACVQLHNADAPAGVYHLANRTPPTVFDGVTAITRALRMRDPRIATASSDLTSLDSKLNRGLDFQRAYLRQEKFFDVTNTLRYVTPGLLDLTITRDTLTDMVRHYLSVAYPDETLLVAQAV